ncbi:MAG: flippase-like domain-containing protein, partial [Chloroflexi bacterium]
MVATAVGLALAAVVIAISHPDKIWASLQQADLMPVLGALALNLPVIWLRALRAQLIVRHLGHRVPMRSMVPIQLVGQTSSTITPAAGGDYVRAYLWRSSNGVPVRVGAAVVTFERLYSLFLMVAVSVLLILFPRHGVIGWVLVAIGLGIATFAPLLFELMPTSIERWALAKLGKGRFMGRFQEGATVMVDQFRKLMKAPLLLAWTSALTLINFIAMGALLWLVMLSLAHRVPITQAVAANSTS